MTTYEQLPSPRPALTELRAPRRAGALLGRPAALFVILSTLFGALLIVLNPPLRGPDEAAHFVRAYAIAGGEVMPSARDAEGRKGTLLPARIHDDFEFFESVRYNVGKPGFSYHSVLDYRRNAAPREEGRAPTFVLYQGSESYSPFSYLPYIAAGAVARLLGLDFVGTLYLMRLFGLIAMTAAAAYAIVLTPRLKWAFLLIAMLPSALYSRAVISADGAALSFTLVVLALCLRTIAAPARRVAEQALWMTLCVTAKLSNAPFVLLEAMRGRPAELARRWPALALITLPGIALSLWWVASTAGDVGTWRVIAGTGVPAERFDIGTKLGFMLANPLHFFGAMISTLDNWRELGRAVIGILGWGDTHLQPFVYPVLAGLLLVTALTPLDLARDARLRAGLVAGLAALGYFVLVFLLFYLTWTPVDEPKIWGVQGRYFVPMLPPLALAIAALVNRGLGEGARGVLAGAGAVLAGAATLEAIWRMHW
jgi:uncharacterized membrane protein